MNIPGMTLTEIAGLAGIEIPKGLVRKKAAAHEKLDRLESEIEKHTAQIAATDIPSLQKKGAIAVVNGKDGSKIQAEIKETEQKLKESRAMLSELNALRPGVQEDLRAAKDEIDGHINAQLVDDHNELLRQLDSATSERARNITTSPDGKYHSSAPEKQSHSRIATCEACRSHIALIDPKKISQPITGADFQPLGGYGAPFHPGCDFLWLRCPRCGNFPWREEDKILTSAGFFSVPSKEQEKND